jgi:hypothetical protein
VSALVETVNWHSRGWNEPPVFSVGPEASEQISALVFTIIPAVKGCRWTPGPSLSARVVMGQRWRHAMITIEAALSVFLLCRAGLVAQNLWKLISASLSFSPQHVLAMRLRLSFGK